MSESDLSRRKAMRLGAAFSGAGFASAAGIVLSAKPAFAIQDKSFTAADVTGLSSDDGLVNDVWVQPDLECIWDGLDQDPDELVCEVWVDTPATDGSSATGTATTNMTSIGTVSKTTLSGLQGSTTITWSNQWSLINDGPWTKQDFKAANNGSSSNTDTIGPIEVVVEARLTVGSRTYTDRARDGFNVEITNEGAGTSVGGAAGTGGNV